MSDDPIEKSRKEEQRLQGPAKRAASEKQRSLKIFSKANDARAFAELLRLANIREDSDEWKRAWKFFYSA